MLKITTAITLQATLANSVYYQKKLKKYKTELDENLQMMMFAWYGDDVKNFAEIAKCLINLIEVQGKYLEKLKAEVERLYQKMSAENKKTPCGVKKIYL